MARRITLQEVAAVAGVSAQTVSRVINGKHEVAAETREAVTRAVKELGYRPNHIARSLVSQHTRTLGVISFPMHDYFMPELLMALEREARRRGYFCILTFTDDDAGGFLRMYEMMLDRRVDGIILSAPGPLTQQPHDIPVPIVSLAHPIEHELVINVDVDNIDGAYQAVCHLTDLGHTRIGVISGVAARKAGLDRNEGARRALAEKGLTLGDSWELSHEWSIDAGYNATRTLLERHPDLTALFCHNDTLAFGAYEALHELGLRIPQDISVVGYDDLPIAPFVSPPLSSVHQPRASLGRLLAQLAVDAIEKGSTIHDPMLLKARLVCRESTAPPRDPSRPLAIAPHRLLAGRAAEL